MSNETWGDDVPDLLKTEELPVDPNYISDFVAKEPLENLVRLNVDALLISDYGKHLYKKFIAERIDASMPKQFTIGPKTYENAGQKALGYQNNNKRVAFLEEGIRLTKGDRNKTHGDYKESMTLFADYLNIYLGKVLGLDNPGLKGSHASMILALNKIARSENGAFNPDNGVDGAVYIAGWAECREVENG